MNNKNFIENINNYVPVKTQVTQKPCQSKPSLNFLNSLTAYAKSKSIDILLRGESGTGKTYYAKLAHCLSGRKGEFVRIHSPSLQGDLWRSELFGYEKGSFTGADSTKQGKFETANNGTIFFDEIADISPQVQSYLLEVLEEKSFSRIGSSKSIKVDAKLIFATNSNLEEMLHSGKLRFDFYQRIKGGELVLIPLKERKEDLRNFILYFIDKYSKLENRLIDFISNKALNKLLSYSWPGNARELEHCIKKAIIRASSNKIEEPDIQLSKTIFIKPTKLSSLKKCLYDFLYYIPTEDIMNLSNKVKYDKAAYYFDNNKQQIADFLGISRSKLFRLRKNISRIDYSKSSLYKDYLSIFNTIVSELHPQTKHTQT